MQLKQASPATLNHKASNHPLLWLSWMGLFLPLLIGGWGWWGHGVLGDYALDLVDAMRRHYGEMPYRDFLPTYGPLHIYLAAPFFNFGRFTFSAYWIFTALLVLFELYLILKLFDGRFSKIATWILGALFLTSCAFHHSNAKFILGYCQSGFLSTILWTGTLLILQRNPSTHCNKGGFIATGVLLGLQLFTKMDAGMVACGIVLACVLTINRRTKFQILSIVAGFSAIVLIVWILLILEGASVQLLWENLMHGFFISQVFVDTGLRNRLTFLILGICSVKLLLFLLRNWIPFAKKAWFITIWAAPVLIGFFGYLQYLRGHDSKAFELLNYYQTFVVIIISLSYGLFCLRKRTFSGLWRMGNSWKFVAILIALGGIARSWISGWYPLNYYQPSLFVLTALSMAAYHPIRTGINTRKSKPVLWGSTYALTMILTIVTLTYLESYQSSRVNERVRKVYTRWGDAWIQKYHCYEIFSKLQDEPAKSGLFTFELPGIYLISGLQPASFLSLQENLAFAGPYQERWEDFSLQMLKKRSPQYVFIPYKPTIRTFGKDYGKASLEYIRNHYKIILLNPERGELLELVH